MINRANNQPNNQPASQPASQPTNQPNNQPASQPANQPTQQPANQPRKSPPAPSRPCAYRGGWPWTRCRRRAPRRSADGARACRIQSRRRPRSRQPRRLRCKKRWVPWPMSQCMCSVRGLQSGVDDAAVGCVEHVG
eukprot:164992-Chlamydomonas_euryale.AAC.4